MPVFRHRCTGAPRSRSPAGLVGLPPRPFRRPARSSGLRRPRCPGGGPLPPLAVVVGFPPVVLRRPKPLVASRSSPLRSPAVKPTLDLRHTHRQEVFARSPGLSPNLFRCPQFALALSTGWPQATHKPSAHPSGRSRRPVWRVPSGSTAQGAASPQRSSKTSSPTGRRRTGPWRPSGRPSAMVPSSSTGSGISRRARSSVLDEGVPHREDAAVAERPRREQEVLAGRVDAGAVGRGAAGGPARSRPARRPASPRSGRRSAACVRAIRALGESSAAPEPRS